MYIYIHIPFCSQICSYCDFAKVYYNKDLVNNYLDSLEKEIKSKYNGEVVHSIYIGGGTPTCLDYNQLKRLFNIISIFNKDEIIEFSIETNVELDETKISLLKQNGVNRISIGVQSFNDDILKTLNRTHRKEDVFLLVKRLKKLCFNNINVDLIYGVNEDINSIKKDISYFLELDVEHVSCYSLILEDNTLLKVNNFKCIDEDIEYDMYKYIENTLEKSGYNHYEISNYAKKGYESIHNKNYWLNQEYLGFGLGAVSYINNYRINNTRNLRKYLAGNYVFEKCYEDEDIRMQTDLMLGFRMIDGINIESFYNKYKKRIDEVYNLDYYINKKILIFENNYLKLDKNYMYLMNEIITNIIK